MATLIISNEEMDDIMKTVKYLEESCSLIKVVNKTIEIEVKVQKGGFLNLLLGTPGASSLGNLLIGKRVKIEIPGREVMKAGEEITKEKQNF